MKCFNCGNEVNDYLCVECTNENVLSKIFEQLLIAKRENCENKYILEYANNFEDFKEIRNCIPSILDKFETNINDFYYCRYYRRTYNSLFEENAIKYLKTHQENNLKKQLVLYDLIKSYLREDYEKPKEWCDIISKDDSLCIELYDIASEYFSMVGDYDIADKLVQLGLSKLNDEDLYLFSNKEFMEKSLNKTSELIVRYRNGKPYWPNTEERRIQIKKIYDEKGISCQTNSVRVHSRENKRVKASDFIVNNEWYDDIPSDYISFYCRGSYSTKTVITMYEIGAVKVSNGTIVDKFYDVVCPWEDLKIRKDASNELGISLEELDKADDVEKAMNKFFEFAGNQLLVSTEGLGLQKNILTRAMRYAFYKELNNPIGDILDYAANKDSKFDFENNTRNYLMKYFNLQDGTNSLDKAIINYKIIEELRKI